MLLKALILNQSNPASHRRQRKGSLEFETVKYGWDLDLRMTVLARTSSNSKRQTRPLIRESAPNQQTRNCLTLIKIWS
jgi:hypothetical protein